MTDYKNLKLIASSSPHIHAADNTRSIMLDVIIAMLPALCWSVYNFGWKALILTAVCVIAAVYLCVTVSSAASSIKTGSEALTQLSGPMTEALEKLSSFDMNAFNKAIESFTNLLKGLPFFGG